MFIHSHEDKHIIIVEKEEPIMESLTRVVEELNIQGGSITGIGAVKDVELGFYDLASQTYRRKMFDTDDYELTSFTGNISLKDGKPYVHAHITMGDRVFDIKGGHLFEAKVAVTSEFHVIPLGVMPERLRNEKIGLDLICRIGQE